MSRATGARTIRTRVGLATFVVLALVLLVAGAIVDEVVERSARRTLDQRLLSEAESLAALTRYDGKRVELEFEDETMTSFASARAGAYFQLSTAAGRVERSASLKKSEFPAPGPEDLAPLSSRRDRRISWAIVPGPREPRVRLVTLAVSRGSSAEADDDERAEIPRITVVVQVARSLAEVEHARSQALVALAIALPLALLLGSGGAFLVASRATAPIDRLTDDATAIASGTPGARLDLARVDGELRRLGEMLNTAFDRLGKTIARERQFSADAAHELKTPLAVARSCLELAGMRVRDPKDYAAAIETALQAMARLEKVVHSLLVLARAESGLAARERLDLRVVAARAVETTGPLAEAAGLKVAFTLPATEIAVLGAEPLLERLVENLVENAIRHGASGQGVEVIVRAAEERAEVSVLDRGFGFPDALLARVFERFARGDESRTRATGGAGLGLSIAKAVALAHGGDVSVERREGGGTRVTVWLPRAGRECAVPGRRLNHD